MTSASPDASEWGFPNRATPVGSPNYYAVRFSPPNQRERNALLIAWYELIQEIADRPHDPGVARLKLDWWREEVGYLHKGCARHPLAVALHAAGVGRDAAAAMRDIIDAAEDEIRVPVLDSDEAFAAACRNTLGSFFVLLARSEPDARYATPACVEEGAFCAAVERIRRLAARPHRVPADLRPRAVDDLTAEQRRQRLDRLLEQFRTGPAGVARREIPDLARRLSALAIALQKKMRRKGYPVGDILIDRPPIAHLWTAWRGR